VHVADVFDALTTKRSYKDAIKSFDAFILMREYSSTYDPHVFKVFVQLMAKEVL
jgi:HD-GYP domain-containing protein (c-di-GMP phosphodiesterase class II)